MRPSGRFGQFTQRFGVLGTVTADDQAALGPRNSSGAAARRPAERGPRRAAGAAGQRFGPPARLPAGTPSPPRAPAASVSLAGSRRLRPVARRRRSSRLRPRPVRDERVTERQVQVHRTRRATRGAGRRTPGPARQRPPVPRLPGAFFRRANLAEPAHRVAVQLDLVDGLVSAGPAQFRRAVRGQHQQRHARFAGLDHRRMEAAAAVPDVQTTHTGRPLAWPGPARHTPPSARRCGRAAGTPPRCARANSSIASGALREPGASTASVIPQRISSSARVTASAVEGFTARRTVTSRYSAAAVARSRQAPGPPPTAPARRGRRAGAAPAGSPPPGPAGQR